MSGNLTKRDGVWHFVRRVPVDVADLDKRGIVKQSTKVRVNDDRAGILASQAAAQINRDLETLWKGLIEGRAEDAARKYKEARRRARVFGFNYLTAAEISELGTAEILQRVAVLKRGQNAEDPDTVAAVFGGAEMPQLMVSEIFTSFESLTRTDRTDMSADQVRKWRNPKVRAMKNFMEVLKVDRPLNRLTRNDALDFAEWWQERVLQEGLDPGTANKDIGHINRMVMYLDKKYRIGMAPIFANTRLEGEWENSRPPFSVSFVQSRLLDPDALDGMNPEARRVVYVMADSGLRPSEIVNLREKTIRLNAEIPHVVVLPDERRLKTPQSRREIPLVGAALVAMRAQPDGFPLYRDRGAELSATVNKFFAENHLKETDEHTLYSLRHTFKDKLIAARADEQLIDSLLGHKNQRPKYGAGYPLDLKLEILHRIAFKPPSFV